MKKFKDIIFSVLLVSFVVLVLISMNACSPIAQAADTESSDQIETWSEETQNEDVDTENKTNASDLTSTWTDETHSNEAEPDYEIVFPQDEVNQINITISEENWETMMADMTESMSEFGARGDMGMDQGGRDQENPPAKAESRGNRQPGGNMDPGGGGMNMDFTEENPVWVTATIEFEGDVWENVGIRFKGNSSLREAWSSGSYKIPFKLDFDQFEDEYPETEDQRFYGFKQLSLGNNFSDDSYLREKVTADIFRDFGVAAAHTAFYEVYVDYGEGLEYFGLYTMVEIVEDTVIEEQFSDDSGNLYKPEGSGASFAEGSFNEVSFDKETNQEEDDYSDILALFDALHADNRLTDPEAWRSGLESVFDVDTFLRWLAVNTTVQNWDTYGVMSHNYYLYTDPETDLITWIPWDNNMALTDSVGHGKTLSFSMDEVTEQWPLIRYIMDDPAYQAQYEANLAEFLETAFVPEELSETFAYYHDLVADSVLKETSKATTLSSVNAFENSAQDLIDHTNTRYQAVLDYLAE